MILTPIICDKALHNNVINVHFVTTVKAQHKTSKEINPHSDTVFRDRMMNHKAI